MAIWARLTFAVFKFGECTFGVLFPYASIIFGEFYFGESKEPRETRVIKFSRKLSILQYISTLEVWLQSLLLQETYMTSNEVISYLEECGHFDSARVYLDAPGGTIRLLMKIVQMKMKVVQSIIYLETS